MKKLLGLIAELVIMAAVIGLVSAVMTVGCRNEEAARRFRAEHPDAVEIRVGANGQAAFIANKKVYVVDRKGTKEVM